MAKVIVTGACGFIGRHVLDAIMTCGSFDVHAVTSKVPPLAHADCTWHVADLLDSAQIKVLFRTLRPTHLMHFAWYVVPGKYWTASENFLWVQASLELLGQFQKCGGQRVVMAGTCAEYDWNYGYCSELLTPKGPTTPYGICKLTLQMLLDSYAKETGLSSAWGRIFLLYGPYEQATRLVPSIINAMLQGEPARCSHSNQIRDFLYVQDVADAFVALLESKVTGPVNIASGQPVTLKQVIYTIAEKLNRDELIQLGVLPTPLNDPRVLIADVSRLNNEVGWLPKYDLNQGLDQTIQWWKKQLSETKRAL
jgi:nucleoside-diphosphate-sugar epimerase